MQAHYTEQIYGFSASSEVFSDQNQKEVFLIFFHTTLIAFLDYLFSATLVLDFCQASPDLYNGASHDKTWIFIKFPV